MQRARLLAGAPPRSAPSSLRGAGVCALWRAGRRRVGSLAVGPSPGRRRVPSPRSPVVQARRGAGDHPEDLADRAFGPPLPRTGANAQAEGPICRFPARGPRRDVGRCRRDRPPAVARGASGDPPCRVRTMTAPAGEARETSGATTGGLLRYVRAAAGDEAVDRVLERAGVPYTADQLED